MKKRTKKKTKPSRRKYLTTEERDLKNLKILGENLENARKMRDLFADMLKDKPTPEGFEHLKELDEAIVIEQWRINTLIAQKFRRDIKSLAVDINAAVEECTDEELLRPDYKTVPEQDLEKIADIRRRLAGTIDRLPPEENPEEILDEFDRVIAEVHQKLDEKRRHAQKQADDAANAERVRRETRELYEKISPGYAKLRADLDASYADTERTPLTADGTEYEMHEEYKDYLERLQAAYDLRDLISNQLQKMKAEKPDESFEDFEETIAALDEQIPKIEKAMENEKQAFQKARRAQEQAEISVAAYENAIQDHIAANPHLLLGGKPKKSKGQ